MLKTQKSSALKTLFHIVFFYPVISQTHYTVGSFSSGIPNDTPPHQKKKKKKKKGKDLGKPLPPSVSKIKETGKNSANACI